MRVLFSAFGSAGDVFPLIPIAQRLRDEGHDVRFAARRSTGLYLRAAGVTSIALGDGSELSATRDPDAVSSRRFGWRGWRRTTESYIAPALEKDVSGLLRVCASWAPDVIAAGSFATAARLMGRIVGTPIVDFSIYPQHESLAGATGGHFSLRLREEARRILRAHGQSEMTAARDLWGAPANVLLYDPGLLKACGIPGSNAVGFTSWNEVHGQASDEERARDFMSGGRGVIVTLGSFLGMVQTGFWSAAASALHREKRQVLFVGVPASLAAEIESEARMAVGYVRLAPVIEGAYGVIHHGGVGTTMTCLRAGVPAVVVPQSYDQFFNGAVVDAVRAGCCVRQDQLLQGFEALEDESVQKSAASIAQSLTSSQSALEAATAALLRAG